MAGRLGARRGGVRGCGRAGAPSPARRRTLPCLAQCLALEVGLSLPPQRPNERRRGCGSRGASGRLGHPTPIPPAAPPHPPGTPRRLGARPALPRDNARLCRAPCGPAGVRGACCPPGSAPRLPPGRPAQTPDFLLRGRACAPWLPPAPGCVARWPCCGEAAVALALGEWPSCPKSQQWGSLVLPPPQSGCLRAGCGLWLGVPTGALHPGLINPGKASPVFTLALVSGGVQSTGQVPRIRPLDHTLRASDPRERPASQGLNL
jgi:hypothetical protein